MYGMYMVIVVAFTLEEMTGPVDKEPPALKNEIKRTPYRTLTLALTSAFKCDGLVKKPVPNSPSIR
jgi:hypothetical protein